MPNVYTLSIQWLENIEIQNDPNGLFKQDTTQFDIQKIFDLIHYKLDLNEFYHMGMKSQNFNKKDITGSEKSNENDEVSEEDSFHQEYENKNKKSESEKNQSRENGQNGNDLQLPNIEVAQTGNNFKMKSLQSYKTERV